MFLRFATDWPSPPPDVHERRRSLARAPQADRETDRETHKRRARARPANRPDDGGFDEFFAGPKLLKSLDAALALPPSARNRALAKIVLGVESGIDQERDTGCECMAPDLSALITLMARDGVDDETRQSAVELAEALQRLAEHGGNDEGRRADLAGFAQRLMDLPGRG